MLFRSCWGWSGLMPTRAAVGSRTFLSLPAWERGALASVPPLTRGLTLSWAGCGLGGRADRGQPRGLPWGAALQRQPSLSWPSPPRARGYSSWCPVLATGMHLRQSPGWGPPKSLMPKSLMRGTGMWTGEGSATQTARRVRQLSAQRGERERSTLSPALLGYFTRYCLQPSSAPFHR